MSVIGGPNNPISNGLVYALDFKNNRCYVSGSNSAKSLLFNPTTASISAGFDNTTNTLIFSGSQNGTTNLTLPQVNYDKSFTISYVANIKNGGLGFGGNYGGSNTILYTYFDTTSIRLGFYGAVTGFNTYFTRTYPASGNNHYTWVYTASGSFTLFVNGVPVSSSGANEQSAVNNSSDFKLSGRASDTFWSGSLGNVYIYNRALTNDEIRTNYTLASREYGLPTPPSFSIDENAYLFSQTAGITSSAYISALDTFVRGLKSASLWDKMVGIYPFLGGNNTLNQLNLKESSLAVYPASFTGNWSSSFSGSRSNTTASYATLTGFTPSTYYPSISSQSIHLTYLSYDTPASGGYLMGVEQLPGLPGDIAAPAAAYSVRKVRTAYTGSAMTVRRDSDDLTFDVGFDASGNLDTGSLLRNMTASLNTPTLPGDYSGLAAAYSLRRVSSSYSGYAVEVRRSSDNVSQSIGFDSFGNFDTASLNRFIATGSGVLPGSYSGLAAAYSLRRVVPGYSGFAIQIESASLTQDIGFDSFDNLDTASIASFAGSGDAFVRIWYDQSGNGYHASQSVSDNQPKIYSGSLGTVVEDNGRPALNFDGVNDILTTGFSSTQPLTSLLVMKSRTNATATRVYLGTNDVRFVYTNAGSGFLAYAGGSTPSFTSFNTNQNLFFTYVSGSTSRLGYNGGTLSSTTNLGSNTLTNMAIGTSTAKTDGTFQEILVFTASQVDNRTYIENNINSYYGIYTPSSVSTENAFVKTWYDQSGNNRHATQVSESRQPQIVENGTIVLDQSRPSLKWNNGIFLYNTSSYTLNSVVWAARATDGTGFSTIVDTGNQLGPSPNVYYDQGIRSYNGLYNIVGNNADSNDLVFDSGSMFFNGRVTTTSNNIQTGHVGFLRVDSTKTSATRTQIGIHYDYDRAWKGYISELVLYSTNLTASRGRIEDNINGYYNIFTQSLASGSGYVSQWYDQSGNNRHFTQTINTRQPIILSSGSILTANNKPAIINVPDGGWQNTDTISTTSNYSFFSIRNNKNQGFLFDTMTGRLVLEGASRAYFNIGSTVGTPLTSNSNRLIEFHLQPSNQSSVYEQGVLTQSGLAYTQVGISAAQGLLRNNSAVNSNAMSGSIQEFLIYNTSQILTRGPITQNINSYFSTYTPLGYNLNTNSLSLFSSPTTVAGAANNVASASFTTGGPIGLITVSRTGSSNYTLWKNKVPSTVAVSASSPQTSSLFLNAANVNNALFSSSQNNIAYASVGAGLTNDETRTYYDLVNTFQTSLGRGVSNPNAFITLWDTRLTGSGTSNSSSIVLPLYGTQAITASWGDGTTSNISSSTQAERTHSYATPGIYTVTITGSGQGFRFNNAGDKTKLLDIGQWGNIPLSITYTFSGCSNLIATAPDPLILNSTDIQFIFNGCSKFNGYVDNWNTSNVTSMGYGFYGATIFNQSIGSWNTSKVTNFSAMFQSQTAFNNGGSDTIKNWNVASASLFDSMFDGATSFNQPIGSWNVSSATSMPYMFRNATAFNQNIGSWDVSKVTNMNQMFLSATNFNNSGSSSINNWRPISCSNFSSMFQNVSVFNQPIGGWQLPTASNITVNMSGMFNSCGINQPLGTWNTSRVTNMSSMFAYAGQFNQNLGAWDVSNVTSMSNMFIYSGFNNSGSSDINNWRPISCSSFSFTFYNADAFNQPVGNWPLSASNIDMSGMFCQTNIFNQNLGSWDVSKVTNMSDMFNGALTFNNSGSTSINNWRPISCSNFNSMFYGATAFNQPIGNWPLSASNINMSSMFRNTSAFNQPIGSWNTSNVTNMGSMFSQATAFNQDISTWDTSKVTDMSVMFYGTIFNQPIGSWNTSKVTNMFAMFTLANGFNQDIGNWNVSNVTNFTEFMNSKINYSYLHTIYDGWINNKLQPQRTIDFNTIKYSGSAAQGRALLTRTYNTASITGYSNDGGFLAITCSANHNVIVGNKVFISGSSYSAINGVQTVLVAGSPTTLTISGSVYDPTATGGTIITGYGWSIADGGPV